MEVRRDGIAVTLTAHEFKLLRFFTENAGQVLSRELLLNEVWGYNSGNGTTVTDASFGKFGGTAVSSSRFCNVNIVMTGGQVSAVNYTGPTGGLLTAGEQCAYAVDACVKRQ